MKKDFNYKPPIKRIQELLGNSTDLRYVCRLAFEEGPWHHAYANSILVGALLKGFEEISKRLNLPVKRYEDEVVEVEMQHPPHLRHVSDGCVYPLDLPKRLLLKLADADERQAEEMIEALSEGAPHHVMTNIITVHISEAIFALANMLPPYEPQ